MSDPHDWRAEAIKKLEELAPKQTIRSDGKGSFCIEFTWTDELLEMIREHFNIPKTPSEPTDEELLDEVNPLLGTSYRPVLRGNVAVLFAEATKRARSIEVWKPPKEPLWYARIGRFKELHWIGSGPTPDEALRNALAWWLRGEWRRENRGVSDE